MLKEDYYDYLLPDINNDFDGYDTLLKLYSFADIAEQNINIVLSEVFDVSLSGLLWCIIEKLVKKGIKGYIKNFSKDTREKWKQNGFYSKFISNVDIESTDEVRYNEMTKDDLSSATNYIDEEVLQKKGVPKMTQRLHKEFNKSIVELMTNCFEHGNAEKVICCGNYSYVKKTLEFTIINLGRTIKENVTGLENQLNCSLIKKSCIEWATGDGNTTVKNISRGFGLTILREFFNMNKGRIYILSDDEMWMQKDGGIENLNLTSRFDGTIVNLEFNLLDGNAYKLINE